MIHVIGDSHVNLFNGSDRLTKGDENGFSVLPDFKTYHIGAHLAYSISVDEHNVRSMLSDIVKRVPTNDILMFVFGEIDCRNHICKQRYIQDKSIEEITIRCVEDYIEGIKSLVEGRNFIMWGPHPIYYIENGCFPQTGDVSVGYYSEINYTTFIFNSHLKRICRQEMIPFATVYFDMVERGCYFAKGYYLDTSHLNNKMLPIALHELKKSGIDVQNSMNYLRER